MKIIIREYAKEDRGRLTDCILKLQHHIVRLDALKRVRPFRRVDVEQYVRNLLEKVNGNEGVIYLAERGQEIVGLIAGNIITMTPAELLESYPSRDGDIIDFFVEESYREKGIGSLLMKKLEAYFRAKRCDAVRVECFIPNKTAHQFYQRKGYIDRVVWLLKRL